jgi:ribonuclease HI
LITTTLDDYNNNRAVSTRSPNLVLPPKINIQVYFDGLCQPSNPGGTLCFVFIVKNEQGNTIYNEYELAAHNSTNNVAEYTGIIKALEWLIANNYQNQSIVIKGDSQLVIQQIKRNFKVKSHNIISLYHDAISLISKFKHTQFELIPREQNKEADRLSNMAYQEQHLGV